MTPQELGQYAAHDYLTKMAAWGGFGTPEEAKAARNRGKAAPARGPVKPAPAAAAPARGPVKPARGPVKPARGPVKPARPARGPARPAAAAAAAPAAAAPATAPVSANADRLANKVLRKKPVRVPRMGFGTKAAIGAGLLGAGALTHSILTPSPR